MISSLHGTIEAIGTDRIILNVNGVGFLVYVPASLISILSGTGSELTLYTHLHVREDNLSLYGFSSEDELRLFEILMTVKGIGPRLSMAMLSAMDVDNIITAISTGNSTVLTSISGVGKKTAERIVLELKEKIGEGWISAPAAKKAHENSDVLDALISLGYTVVEATHAVASLPSTNKLSLEAKLKLALQYYNK